MEDVQLLDNYSRNIAAFEQLVKVYRELINGESSGLTQLQLDQVESGLQGAQQQFVSARQTYRSRPRLDSRCNGACRPTPP